MVPVIDSIKTVAVLFKPSVIYKYYKGYVLLAETNEKRGDPNYVKSLKRQNKETSKRHCGLQVPSPWY